MLRIINLIIPVLAMILISCEPISYRDYEMEAYSGAFNWDRVTKKAEWSNRYDHAAVAFDGRMWILGGYDSGRLKGDSYLEDVWNSEDGISWSLVSESAPWNGRRGHTLTVFDDGSGEALFLIGGFEVDEKTGYRQYTNDVWKSEDGISWTRIKERTYPAGDMNVDFMPRMDHVCISARQNGTNYLFLIGGTTQMEDFSGFYAQVYFHDVWRSQDGILWEKLDNNDYGQRAEHTACTDPATGRIYLQGGTHGVTFDNEDLNNHPAENYYSLWFSDDGVNWEVDETFELERAGHSLILYEQALWLLPGKIDSQEHTRFAEGDLYYTYVKMQNEDWSLDSKGSAFSGRHSYATVEFKNRLWVLGGETADNGPNNDVWSGTINQ